MSDQLYLNGFVLAKSSYVKVRNVYLDVGTTVATFNELLTSAAIKNAWMFYLNTSSLAKQSFDSSQVSVSMIDQNLYYDQR